MQAVTGLGCRLGKRARELCLQVEEMELTGFLGLELRAWVESFCRKLNLWVEQNVKLRRFLGVFGAILASFCLG
jgi:hypothetical protein